MDKSEELTKVHIDLPNHWATGGESMWAAQVGPDLFELRNTPFYAYDLNWGDVVHATEDAPNLKPFVRKVVRRSGHATLRLLFKKHVAKERALELLDELKSLDASYEGVDAFYFALDLLPESPINKVRDVLDGWMAQGWLEYETCQARVEGSFDDAPEDNGDESS